MRRRTGKVGGVIPPEYLPGGERADEWAQWCAGNGVNKVVFLRAMIYGRITPDGGRELDREQGRS